MILYRLGIPEYFSRSYWIDKFVDKVYPYLHVIQDKYNIGMLTVFVTPGLIIIFFLNILPSIKKRDYDRGFFLSLISSITLLVVTVIFQILTWVW